VIRERVPAVRQRDHVGLGLERRAVCASGGVRFFDDNEVWLARVLDEGRRAGSIRFEGSARPVARTLIGGLEGAMLVARPYHGVKRFRAAADLLIRGLAVEAG
jgi:hypothetical protein